MLFAGPDGVGKKLFAFELARMLICPDNGCEACPVCKGAAQYGRVLSASDEQARKALQEEWGHKAVTVGAGAVLRAVTGTVQRSSSVRAEPIRNSTGIPTERNASTTADADRPSTVEVSAPAPSSRCRMAATIAAPSASSPMAAAIRAPCRWGL